MSADDLNIAPDQVKYAGNQVSDLSTRARSRIAQHFDSAAKAHEANPGFATGPAATTYSDHLHSSIDRVLQRLESNAQSIVRAATSLENADSHNASGFNRDMAAINGLTKPQIPGR